MQRAVAVEQVLDPGRRACPALGRERPPLVPQRAGSRRRRAAGSRSVHESGTRASSAADRLVDGVRGHHPVGRVLAAGDHDQAGHRVPDHVLAGQLGRRLGLAGQQRAQPGVDALDVLAWSAARCSTELTCSSR